MPRDEEETHTGTEDEDEGEGAEGEEEVEEEEEPEQPARLPPATVAASPKPKRNRPPGRPRTAGLGAAPPAPLDPQSPAHPFKKSYGSEYADQIIEELFDRLRQYPEVGTIYDFDVECVSLDGQTAVRQVGRWQLATFQGDQVRTPGMILRDRVIDECHMIVSKGQPVTYDIWFGYRHGHRQHTRGKLPLGSVDEINALRRAQMQGRMTQTSFGAPPAPAYPPPAGYGGTYVPPAPQPQQQPAPAPQGFGAAPPSGYATPSYDPYLEQLRQELRAAAERSARTEGMLVEVMQAFREGRAPNVSPSPAAAPPAPGPVGVGGIREMIQHEVASAVGAGISDIKSALGIKPGQQAASPGSKIAESLLGGVERMVTGIFNETMTQVDKSMRSKIKDSMGLGGVPGVAEEEEEVETPADALPYVAVPTGAAWADGRPVVQTRDKNTGGMDWGAFVTNNPIIMEQGGAVVMGAVAGLKDMLSKIQLADGSQVVSRTPRGTVDGTPRPGTPPAQTPGMGAIPDPPPPPPPPAAARPAANGASRTEARPAGGGFATH